MVGCEAGFLLHGLVHLLTDDVNESLEHLLDVDVVLGAGLEELKAELLRQPLAFLCSYKPVILKVTFVSNQNHLSVVPGVRLDLCCPVLHRTERVLVGDVIHEQEAHGSSVVGRSDRTVALLPCCVPNLQLDPLVVAKHGFDLEVDAHGADEGGGEGVVRVAEQEGGFPNAAVADDQQLEHVVEVLVGRVFLGGRLMESGVARCHLSAQ